MYILIKENTIEFHNAITEKTCSDEVRLVTCNGDLFWLEETFQISTMKVILEVLIHVLNTKCKLVMAVRHIFNTQYNSSVSLCIYMVFHMNNVIFFSPSAVIYVILAAVVNDTFPTQQHCLSID